MKVKTISTQSKDENGKPLYFVQDLNKLCKTESERAEYMHFLKEFRMEIVIFIVLLVFGIICPINFKTNLANVVGKGVYLGVIYVVGIYITKQYKYFEVLIKRKRYE